MSRRNYCGTLNNPTGNEADALRKSVERNDEVKFICGQDEVGKQGTPHIQFYVEFTKTVRRKQAKQLLGSNRLHLEPRYGSQEEAIDYCVNKSKRRKGGTLFSFGRRANQGERTDVKLLVDSIKEGYSYRRLWGEYPIALLRSWKGVLEMQRVLSGVRDWKTGCYIIHGDSGTGKSRMCRDLFPDAYWLLHRTGKLWYDGYVGQETIIIDDFGRGSMSFLDFKLLCDRYPYLAEIKCGRVQILARRVIITSNIAPERFWNWENCGPFAEKAFNRRIDGRWRMGELQTYETVKTALKRKVSEVEGVLQENVPNKRMDGHGVVCEMGSCKRSHKEIVGSSKGRKRIGDP